MIIITINDKRTGFRDFPQQAGCSFFLFLSSVSFEKDEITLERGGWGGFDRDAGDVFGGLFERVNMRKKG